MEFKFHGELLQYRAEVMDALSAAGYTWLIDYRSIDVDHQEYLLEVDGVPDERVAWRIANVVARRFPWGILGYEKYAGDWLLVLVLRGRGIKLGGHDDGGRPSSVGFEIGPAEGEETDGTTEEQPIEASEDGLIRIPGGIPMAVKPLAPELTLARYAKLLHALGRGNYTPTVEMVTTVGAGSKQGDAPWDGMIRLVVRLSDIRVTITQLRQLLPTLRVRPDLVDLMTEALIVASRDRLDTLLADLPPAAAIRYEPLALLQGTFHPGLTVLEPSSGESWRLEFLVQSSLISQVLDQAMQRLAAEGTEALDEK